MMCTVAVLTAAVAGCSSDSDSSSPASSSPMLGSTAAAQASGATSSTPPVESTEGSPTAASTPESSYIEALPPAGVPVREAESVVGTGQRICKALSAGQSLSMAAQFGIDEQPWTPEQANTAVAIAANFLCPQNSERVGN